MCSWPQGGEGSPTLVGLHQDTSEGEPSFQDLHVGDSFNIPTLRAQEGLTLPRGGIVDVPVLGHWLDRGRDPQVWGLRDVEPLTFEGLSPSARHTPFSCPQLLHRCVHLLIQPGKGRLPGSAAGAEEGQEIKFLDPISAWQGVLPT